MNAIRFAALAAVPAALLLSACAGGSSGVVGGGGGGLAQQANVRFVDGSPSNQSIDVYFQSNGSAAPSSPLVAALPYAVPSDFKVLPTVAGSVIVQTAGRPAPSTGTAALTSCPVPQFGNNGNYSIVITQGNGVLNCAIFQDNIYTSASQYRFHNASPNAGGTVAYGTVTAPGVPGATFTVQGTAPVGQLAAGASAATSYTQISPVTLGTTSNVSFAVGPNSGAQTSTATNTLDASALTLPGTTTQPNAGNNTFTAPAGYAGASIYDIACAAGVTLPPGAHCIGNNALIGVFDSH